MSNPAFDDALKTRARLRETFAVAQTLEHKGSEVGALLGFALNSETLDILAVTETRDLRLLATPADEISAPGHLNVGAMLAISRRTLSAWRHKSGGLYTRIGIADSAAGSLVLYVSHHDGLWWLRPRAMFMDGRFTPCPDLSPIAIDLTGKAAHDSAT